MHSRAATTSNYRRDIIQVDETFYPVMGWRPPAVG